MSPQPRLSANLRSPAVPAKATAQPCPAPAVVDRRWHLDGLPDNTWDGDRYLWDGHALVDDDGEPADWYLVLPAEVAP